MPDAVPDVARVVTLVEANRGISRARAATLLGGRRTTALALIQQAIDERRVRVDESVVPIRAGGLRTVAGLYAGADDELLVADLGLPGAELLRLRERAGVSAGALAAALGVSHRQLRRWEAGPQVMPGAIRRRLAGALEQAQLDVDYRAPVRHGRHELRVLVERIAAQPGRSTYQLVRTSPSGRALLEQARASGAVYQHVRYAGRSRQPVEGWYARAVATPPAPPAVRVDELRAARLAAGWSQQRVADTMTSRRLPVTRMALANWERTAAAVPGWAAPAAARVLATLREAASARVVQDPRDRIAAAVQASPGATWREAVAAAGWSLNPTARRYVRELLEAGRLHEQWRGERGQRHGLLYPGPAPAAILTPQQLRARRTGAGLLQRELADLAGAPLARVREWEEGRRRIPPAWQARLDETLAAQPDRRAAVALRVQTWALEALAEGPRTRHQLEQLEAPGSRREVDEALAFLEQAGQVHRGRAAGVDVRGRAKRGRVAWVLGPATPATRTAAGARDVGTRLGDDDLE